MIKVRVGQVWNSIDTGRDLHIDIDSIEYCDDINTDSYFVFFPQNDLEKLAINETEWFHSDCDFVRLDEFDRPMYTSDIDHPLNENYYYWRRQEWQNMRYHLGLDEKPHYRQVKGEWVKQC